MFSNAPGTFFIDGPDGTGKTFLYRAILATIRSKHLIALATESSGVATSILPGGQTAHSRFKITLDIEKNMACCISQQSGLAKLLRVAKLIIWDEAPKSRRQTIEALDRMLQDVNESELPFGGKVVVFGGDFRQVLPVVPKATKQERIDASLIRSYLWPILVKINLTENMRAKLDPMFSEYLLWGPNLRSRPTLLKAQDPGRGALLLRTRNGSSLKIQGDGRGRLYTQHPTKSLKKRTNSIQEQCKGEGCQRLNVEPIA